MKIKPAKYAAGFIDGYQPQFAEAECKCAACQQKERPSYNGAAPCSSINQVPIVSPDDLRPLVFEPQDLTSPRAGFFSCKNDRAEKAALDAGLKRLEDKHFRENPRPAGRPTAEKARLVKDRKSPTRVREIPENAAKGLALASFAGYLNRRGVTLGEIETRDVVQPIGLHADRVGHIERLVFNKETGELIGVDNAQKTAIARVSHREWSGEYRIRVTTNLSPSEAPPQQAGDRVTKFLTTRGAKNILDSGAFVAAVRGGYTTFLTLTFKDEARARIVSGESTIGAECSRFFDAAQKMYQRGWCADKTVIPPAKDAARLFSSNFECVANDEQMVEAAPDSLDYLWVAEAPINKDGEVNPHCHVLMRWQVEPHLFRAWAARIESIWGQGFAKLERIKNADAASGYMLKALGYLMKGQQAEQSDQGEIRGNRYNISKSARALPWEEIAAFHAEHMASIIGEVKAKLERKAAPTVNLIKQSGKALKKAVRDKAYFQSVGASIDKVNARIKAIENSIAHYKAQLRQSPVRAHDYMISFKDESGLNTFLDWAVGVRFWSAKDSASPHPESRLNASLFSYAVDGIRKSFSKVRNRFLESESLWVQRLAAVLPPEVDREKAQADNLNDFLEYERCLSA